MTADPTPEAIRQALEVLGIDPDDVRTTAIGTDAWGRGSAAADRAWEALDAAVHALDTPTPRPVTADTPAGTWIAHPDFPEYVWTFDGWNVGIHDAALMAHLLDLPSIPFPPHGWVEVRRPEPVPVQSDPEDGERDE